MAHMVEGIYRMYRDGRVDFRKQIYGGVLGLAVGDALGVPVEFMSRQEISRNPVSSMRGYGTHDQPAGTWSDDTSLTLALMDSIIEKGGIDYTDIMDRFTGWLMYGDYTAAGEVFDVGNATSRAIMNYGRGMDPLECGGISEYENGNGSLMRILPLAYYFRKRPDDVIGVRMETVHNVSALTHRHPISLIGCGIYINIAMKLLTCESSLYTCIEQGINETFGYYETRMHDNLHSYIRLKRLSDFAELPGKDIKSSGYIVDTLEAAVWCLLNTDSYRKCVLKAVNLGDDTDTVGAVAGGLAGIYYGYEEIPYEWLNVLAKRKYIEEICKRLTAGH